MAETIKLPVIGPTDRRWVIAGGALIVGFVAYAWWTRAGGGAPEEELTEEDIPQDRLPPPTVVGETSYDTDEVRAIINTNAEWYTAAVEYLVGTGGFEFAFTTITLGKFLARQALTQSEANLVQAAKGAVGEPPLGGPWPIILATAPGPTPTPTPTPGRPPQIPIVGIIKLNRRTIRLTWVKRAGIISYEVQRVPGGSWRDVGNVSSWQETVTKSGTYAWNLRGKNAAGVGPVSRSSSVSLRT
jgi:hypothetical protein